MTPNVQAAFRHALTNYGFQARGLKATRRGNETSTAVTLQKSTSSSGACDIFFCNIGIHSDQLDALFREAEIQWPTFEHISWRLKGTSGERWPIPRGDSNGLLHLCEAISSSLDSFPRNISNKELLRLVESRTLGALTDGARICVEVGLISVCGTPERYAEALNRLEEYCAAQPDLWPRQILDTLRARPRR